MLSDEKKNSVNIKHVFCKKKRRIKEKRKNKRRKEKLL